MSFRCKHNNLIMHTAVPYGQDWTCWGADPIEEMLKPDYYASVTGIRVGDEIKVIQTERNDNKSDVLALAYITVIGKDGSVLRFHTTKPSVVNRKLDKAA